MEVHRASGVTQKTAWFMLHRIRLAMQDDRHGGKLAGEVEVDETFIGGKARNMHNGKRAQKITGRGPKDKTIVCGSSGAWRQGSRKGRHSRRKKALQAMVTRAR